MGAWEDYGRTAACCDTVLARVAFATRASPLLFVFVIVHDWHVVQGQKGRCERRDLLSFEGGVVWWIEPATST